MDVVLVVQATDKVRDGDDALMGLGAENGYAAQVRSRHKTGSSRMVSPKISAAASHFPRTERAAAHSDRSRGRAGVVSTMASLTAT
jgi:hypothetical protein